MYKMQKLAQLINRIREIVGFELGKEIQKDIFYHWAKKFILNSKLADPNSKQDACHMNFVIDLAHSRAPVTQW